MGSNPYRRLTDVDLKAIRHHLQEPQKAAEFLQVAGIIGDDGQLTEGYGGTSAPSTKVLRELCKEDVPMRTVWYSVGLSSRYPVQVGAHVCLYDEDVARYILVNDCAQDFWRRRRGSHQPQDWPLKFCLYEDQTSDYIFSYQVKLDLSPRFY